MTTYKVRILWNEKRKDFDIFFDAIELYVPKRIENDIN